MNKIKIGCETYTWQMPGEQYKGRLEHIMDICKRAGFDGIEPESSFLKHLSDPMLMQEALELYNLDLAVLCIVEDWLHSEETEDERVRADQWIDFLKYFPETILLLVQMPQDDRKDLRERQKNCIACVNAIARRAGNRGIICSKHPNSPQGSVFRTAEDYEVLLSGLDRDVIGFCPDVGHIAKGGMNPLAVVKQYRSEVNLIHYKDMFENGEWAPTGEGIIDFTGITNYLIETDFHGWIIMEDECDEAITDPDGLTIKDGQWINENLQPLIK